VIELDGRLAPDEQVRILARAVDGRLARRAGAVTSC
jgi:hypothetical protein